MPWQHPTMRQGRADSRDIPAAQLRAKGRQVIQEASNLRFCASLRFRQERRKAAASSTSPSYLPEASSLHGHLAPSIGRLACIARAVGTHRLTCPHVLVT